MSLGLLFALIALGFMLIVGVMEVINLAHGSLFALGAYVAIFLLGYKLPYYAALLLAPVLVALFGMLLELCMRRTYGKDALYGLLLTFGAALVIEELIRLAWSSGAALAITPLQDLLALPSAARMNVPGRAEGQWRWRCSEQALRDASWERLHELTRVSGRAFAELRTQGDD